jgi:hypothetical protein
MDTKSSVSATRNIDSRVPEYLEVVVDSDTKSLVLRGVSQIGAASFP